MKNFLSTKTVARLLNVNEKMVYFLVAEKGLPATKITGKWIFPQHLVEQWIENSTINYPESVSGASPFSGLLIVCGSNDPLLDRALSLFNALHPDLVAVFGNLGSMGGLKALRRDLCHIASSHLLQEDDVGYNFEFAGKELDQMPAIVNFCQREQGLLVARGNPQNISAVSDLARPGITITNRPLGTGTRLLFDRELKTCGLQGDKLPGYHHESLKHLDVGLEILSGRADAGPGIRTIADLFNIEFIPFRWERYDLMISKGRFFEEGVQRFLGLLHEAPFKDLAANLSGYDLSLSGKMVYPDNSEQT